MRGVRTVLWRRRSGVVLVVAKRTVVANNASTQAMRMAAEGMGIDMADGVADPSP